MKGHDRGQGRAIKKYLINKTKRGIISFDFLS